MTFRSKLSTKTSSVGLLVVPLLGSTIVLLHLWSLVVVVEAQAQAQAGDDDYDYGVKDPRCLTLDRSINSQPQLIAGRAVLTTEYPEVLVPTEEPLEIDIFHNYGSGSAVLWTRMLQSCTENNPDNALCLVKTKTKFRTATGPGGGNGQPSQQQISTTYVTEKDKPVCFSPTCTDNDVVKLDPTPARCQAGMDCEVLSYEVECPPGRQLVSNNGVCTPPLAADSAFFRQRSFVEGSILANCVTSIGGDAGNLNNINNNNNAENDLCVIQTGILPVFTLRNFTDHLTNQAYQEFALRCQLAGGEICRVDMVTANLVPNNMGQVQMYKTYIDYPLCQPVLEDDAATCRNDVHAVMTRRFATEISVNDCNVRNNTCYVDITDVKCDGGMPSTSPSLSPVPTITPMPTRDPGSPDTVSPTKEVVVVTFTDPPTAVVPKTDTTASPVVSSKEDVVEEVEVDSKDDGTGINNDNNRNEGNNNSTEITTDPISSGSLSSHMNNFTFAALLVAFLQFFMVW